MTFHDLDLRRQSGVATRLSGRVELQGEVRDYRGRFEVANAGRGWSQVAVRGDLRGDLRHLELEALQGEWLRGHLDGAARLDWEGPVQLAVRLRGRGLDTGGLLPLPVSGVDLELDGRWRAGADGGRGEVGMRLHRGRIAGYDLHGTLDGGWQDGDLCLSALEVAGSGLTLRGSGRLAERLSFSLVYADPEPQPGIPAANLAAEAWLARRRGLWSGAGSLAGGSLRAGALTTGALRAEAAAGEDGSMRLALDIDELRYAGVRLRTLALRGEGTAQAHGSS